MVTDAMRAAAAQAICDAMYGIEGGPLGPYVAGEEERRLADAALEAAEAAAWQPIETAPRDRFILLWCPEDQSRWLARYQGGRWYGVDDEGLTREGMGPEDVTGWAITHWWPLPVPPVTSAAPNATACRAAD